MSALASEALHNAVSNTSTANYAAIFEGFTARGIPESDIKPRENVFTYNAWKALGRHVRAKEKGVATVTWKLTKASRAALDNARDGETVANLRRYPKTAYVFHISQTDPN